MGTTTATTKTATNRQFSSISIPTGSLLSTPGAAVTPTSSSSPSSSSSSSTSSSSPPMESNEDAISKTATVTAAAAVESDDITNKLNELTNKQLQLLAYIEQLKLNHGENNNN